MIHVHQIIRFSKRVDSILLGSYHHMHSILLLADFF